MPTPQNSDYGPYARFQDPFDVRLRSIFKIIFALALVVFLFKIFDILLLILLGLFLTVAMGPVVSALERAGLSRVSAVSVIGLILTSMAGASAFLILPAVFNQVLFMTKVLPSYQQQLMDALPLGEDLKLSLGGGISISSLFRQSNAFEYVSSFVGSTVDGISQIFLILVFSIYLLADGKRAAKWVLDFFSAPTRLKFRATFRDATVVINGYVIGQLLTSIGCGVFSYVVLWQMKVPGALTLSVIAAVADIVPIIGFFIALVPAALVALTVSQSTAIWVVALYALYHGFETYVLAPYLYGNTMKVSSLVILTALLIAGKLGGGLAALAILPVVAAYPIIERIWLVKYLGRRVIQKHALTDDVDALPEQVAVWGKFLQGFSRPATSSPGAGMAKLFRKRVLLVEDDEDIRWMLKEILSTEGYETVEAGNGREGLELLKTTSQIGLILLDIQMPVMNGRTFLDTIKAANAFKHIPVIFLSSSVDEVDVTGSVATLKKPSEIDALLDFVDTHFRYPDA